MFRWKHTEKTQQILVLGCVHHVPSASATPASCMKWHIGSVWTNKGNVKACLLCGDNVDSLCEKGWYLTI